MLKQGKRFGPLNISKNRIRSNWLKYNKNKKNVFFYLSLNFMIKRITIWHKILKMEFFWTTLSKLASKKRMVGCFLKI